MTTRMAVIRDADGVVTNIIWLDASSGWIPPAGHSVVEASSDAAIGGPYDTAAGTFAPAPPPPERPLEDAKAEAIARVDAEAENVRWRWITAGAGQALVYEAKRCEAEAWSSETSPPALTDYPLMRSRAARLNAVAAADVTEAQMKAVAAEWLAKSAMCRDTCIAIEAVREQAKEDIAAAADAAAVQAVLEGLGWPALQDGGD